MDYNEVYEKTKALIVDYLKINSSELKPETNLVNDLFADSIALVELGFQFSETFNIPMIEAKPELFVMKDLVSHIFNVLSE
ncbi:acyl carrier protein [Acetivibrio cellulolyticus]|uniref:acyl carrier protein n=1 Tax=Acetivibrio cellulolyticus TaxID=35830 RepID=UPI0001E2EBF2|nr:phosphopantetheine-binding protein [Acetivibrio cellulolyticus]